jgi:N-acetylglutamate synthase-like GNAT family acetyltransferase
MESSPRRLNLFFRDYLLADRDGCLDVFDSNVPEFFSESEREGFSHFLDRLPGRYGVIVDATGRIVGCGGIADSRSDPNGIDLTWGMVHGSLHRKGIGRLLTRERLAWAEQIPTINVVYLNTSHITEGFYETFGFRTVQRIPNGYRDGLDRCDMVRTCSSHSLRR